jgi:glycosyltransferase involved in cell wall biosynthesis
MDSKVSVVCRAHGAAPHLETTIKSVLNQTHLDQMIIVIDKPEDPLLEIEFKFQTIIDFVHLDKSNLSRAMNLGIEKSRNNLIANIDGDDTMVFNRLKIQSNFLSTYSSIPLIGTNYSTFDEHGKNLNNIAMPHLIKKEALNRWSPCPIVHSSIMFRKDAILAVGGYKEIYAWAEDLDLYFRLNKFYDLVNLQSFLTNYRIYSGQSTSRNFKTIATSIVQSKIENRIIQNIFINKKDSVKFMKSISIKYYLIIELILLNLNSILKKNNGRIAYLVLRVVLLIIDPKRKICLWKSGDRIRLWKKRAKN